MEVKNTSANSKKHSLWDGTTPLKTSDLHRLVSDLSTNYHALHSLCSSHACSPYCFQTVQAMFPSEVFAIALFLQGASWLTPSLLQVFAQGSVSQWRPPLTTLFQIPTSLPTQHSCPPPPCHVVFSIPLIIWHSRYFTYMILSASSPWRQRFLLYYIPII